MFLYSRRKSNRSASTRQLSRLNEAKRAANTRTPKVPSLRSGQNWNALLTWPFILLITLTLGIVLTTCGTPAQAAIDRVLPFSARLKGTSGDIVPDGNYDLTFKIYTAESGGTAAWTETQTVSVTDGVVSTTLGNTTAFPSTLTFNEGTYYLGITVESDAEMSPRKRIGAVPVAFNSDTVDGFNTTQTGEASSVTVTDSTGSLTLQGGLTVGTPILPSANGTINIGSSTMKFGTLFVNSISASSTTISGTESEAFSINTDQATNNTENSAVQFYLGPTLNTYAALQWNGSANRFDLYSRTDNSTVAALNMGALTATTGSFSGTLGATGATTLSSTLGVTGATTLLSTLGVTGAATFNSTLAVTGNTTLTGDIAVNGGDITTTASTLNVDVANGGTIVFRDGSNTLVSITDNGTTGNMLVTGTLTSTGAFVASSTGNIVGNFSVNTNQFTVNATNGNTSVGGTLGVTGATTLSSTLAVTSNATVGGTLGVTGAATLSSTLGVTGDATLGGTLGVTGATTLSSTLGVTGLSTLGRLTVNGDASVGNNDIILGDAVTDQIVITGSIASSILPLTDATYDLGSASKRFANFYAANAVFDQLSTPNTTANTFVINSDAAADDEDSALEFERGSVTNAIIGWNTTTELLYANTSFIMQGSTTLGDASEDAVTSNAAAWTFNNATTVALASSTSALNFDSNTLVIDSSNNRIGIGDATPAAALTVGSGDLFQVNSSGTVSTSSTITSTSGLSAFSSTTAGHGLAVGASALASSERLRVVTNQASQVAAKFEGAATSHGVGIQAGSSSSEYILYANNFGGSTVLAAMGDGTVTVPSGQLRVATTGSSAGILLGGDAQIYRSAADTLRTPDSLVIDSNLSVGTTPSASHKVYISGSDSTAYSASAQTQAATASDLMGIINGNGSANFAGLHFQSARSSGSDAVGRMMLWNSNPSTGASSFVWQLRDATAGNPNVATTRMELTNAGQLLIPTTGSSAGILLGGDAPTIYRGASGQLNFGANAYINTSGVASLGTSTTATGGLAIYKSTGYLETVANASPALTLTTRQGFSSNVISFRGADSNGSDITNGRIGIEQLWSGSATYSDFVIRLLHNNSSESERLRVTGDGQLRVPTTGSGAGIVLGGDTQLYRSAADVLNTPDALVVGGQLSVTGSGSSNGLVMGTTGSVNLYFRTDDTLKTDDSLEVAGSVSIGSGGNLQLSSTASTTTINAVGGSNKLQFYVDSVERVRFDVNGQVQIPTTGSSAGILLGGDAQLYRSAADMLRTPDSLTVDGTITSGLINSQTISSAANFTGTVTVATSLSTPIVTSASALAITSGSNGNISVTPNGTGDIRLVVSGNASQDVFIGDGGTTNYAKFDTNGAVTFAGAARPYSEITLLPDDAVLPGSNNCARNQTNATNHSYFTLDCDAATDESAFWQFKMPQNYANGTNVQVDIYWEANATSGAAVFDTAYVGVADGENFDGATLTSVSGSADTTAGTAYYMNTATLTLTSPTIDANDIVSFKLIRNADTGSDDLAVDAKVLKVRLRFLTGS